MTGRRIRKRALHLRRRTEATSSSSTLTDYAAASGADSDSARFHFHFRFRPEATEADAPSSARRQAALEDRDRQFSHPRRRIASASSTWLLGTFRPERLPYASAPSGWDVVAGWCSKCAPASPVLPPTISNQHELNLFQLNPI